MILLIYWIVHNEVVEVVSKDLMEGDGNISRRAGMSSRLDVVCFCLHCGCLGISHR